MAQLRQEYPGQAVDTLMKRAGELWATADEATKTKFQDMAKQDRARYDQEVLAFNSKQSAAQNGSGKKSKKSLIPGEVKPKRTHTSSFLLFCQEKRDQVKASGQSMTQT